MEIVEITPENISRFKLFCTQSKNAQEGIDLKKKWFLDNYDLGLRTLYIVDEHRICGFIEYSLDQPFRSITSDNFSIINCIWAKPGYGKPLLTKYIDLSINKNGMAVLTSNNMWLAEEGIFFKNGFSQIDEFVYKTGVYSKKSLSIKLLSRKNNSKASDPSFNLSFLSNYKKLKGINIIYSNQCPYIRNKLTLYSQLERELEIHFNYIEISSRKDLIEYGGIYGSFAIVVDGEYITHTIVGKKGMERIIDLIATSP